MSLNTRKMLKGLGLLLLLGLMGIFNLMAHEFGHCLLNNALGGHSDGVYIWPGRQVWPLAEFGDHYTEDTGDDWRGYAGICSGLGELGLKAEGFVRLMGSGTTALLAVLALGWLLVAKPRKGLGQTLLLIQAVMFIDLLTYVILPEWFGLPHFFFFGGPTSEPLDAAVMMGFGRTAFVWLTVGFSLLMAFGWWKAFRSCVGSFPTTGGAAPPLEEGGDGMQL